MQELDLLPASATKTTSKDLEELITTSKLDEQSILIQVRDCFERGYQLARDIRIDFENEDKLYNNQKKNLDNGKRSNKIGDNTYFSVTNALMAREYVNRPTSEFQAVSPAQMNQVKNLNAALDSDFNTKEYENHRYEILQNKYRR